MSLKDLKSFATGLALYKPDLVEFRKLVDSVIIEKEKAEKKMNKQLKCLILNI